MARCDDVQDQQVAQNRGKRMDRKKRSHANRRERERAMRELREHVAAMRAARGR